MLLRLYLDLDAGLAAARRAVCDYHSAHHRGFGLYHGLVLRLVVTTIVLVARLAATIVVIAAAVVSILLPTGFLSLLVSSSLSLPNKSLSLTKSGK